MITCSRFFNVNKQYKLKKFRRAFLFFLNETETGQDVSLPMFWSFKILIFDRPACFLNLKFQYE